MPRTGGDDLAELLIELGIDVVFGVVSVHNLPLVEAVSRRLRFVPTRHEQAAVNAADGYARARLGLGVAITSTGTGAGNAAGALIECLSAGTPVLHVTGQVDTPWLDTGRGALHETKDQLGMLAAVSKAARRIDDAGSAVQMLADLVTEATTAPFGPVSVEWPIDLQYSAGDLAAAQAVTPTTPERASNGLDRAVELLAGASKPLIWAGGGALGARAEVIELLECTGAGLLTSNAGRTTVREDDPRCIGNFAASPACGQLLGDADLLVSIGTHFRSNETRTYRLELPRPHVQIDVDARAIGRVHAADTGLVGDARTVLRQLLDRGVTPTPDPAWAARVRQTRDEVRRHLRAAIGPQAVICDELRRLLPEQSVIARDITIPSSAWGNRLLPLYEPGTNVYPRGGGVGQGLAMAIGCCVARPDAPTALIVGDGGLVAQLGELATLAQERPWLVMIVFNDAGYGVLRNMQDAAFGHRFGVDLTTPDLATMASAFGLGHGLVRDVAEFGRHLESALNDGRPAMIEVDVAAIGDMRQPFTPPVTIPAREE